jgi:hypothetical protein
MSVAIAREVEPVASFAQRLTVPLRGSRSEVIGLDAEALRGVFHSGVVGCQDYFLSVRAEEFYGCEMERVERSHGSRKRLERSSENRRDELEKRDPLEQLPDVVGVRSRQSAGVNARPDLVLQKPAGDE